MQQSSNPHIDIYLVFSFLFYRWILLQIKLTTAISDLSLVIVYNHYQPQTVLKSHGRV